MFLKRLLINRPLGLLWAGQVISKAGDVAYQIGLLWLLLEISGSKSLTGLVATLSYLPTLILGLWAGALADRLPKVKAMLASDAMRALLVFSVPVLYLFGLATPFILGVITFLVASFATLFNPARDALIPYVVQEEDLFHANSLIQTSWQFSALLGPLLAGFILKAFGLLPLFLFDGLTFLFSFWAIASLKGLEPDRPKGGEALRASGALKSLLEGLKYAFGQQTLVWLLIVTAVDNLVLMGAAMIGTPIFVREVLHLGPSAYAIIEAGYAGGIILGAPLVAYLGKRFRKGRLILFGIVMDGLTFVPLFWVKSLFWALVTIIIHSVFIPMITVSRATLVQAKVEEGFRARVFSMIEVAVTGFTALSVALTGLLADFAPINVIYAAIGFLAAAVGCVGFFIKGLRDAS